MQAMNEELRSTMEELETGKEELQSVNEELVTINHELKDKVTEVIQSNAYLHNLMSSTEIGTIFTDRDLRIKLFTPRIADVFHVTQSDIGRPLEHLAHRLDYDELNRDVARVLRTLKPIKRQVKVKLESSDNRKNAAKGAKPQAEHNESDYIARLVPYRSVDDKIEGVVLTLIDVSELRNAEDDLRESEEHFSAIIKQTTAGMVQTDLSGKILLVNTRFCEIIGYDSEELPQMNLRDIIYAEDLPQSSELLARVAKEGTPSSIENRLITKDGSLVWVQNTVSAIVDADGKPTYILAVVLSIADRKEQEINRLGTLNRDILESIDESFFALDRDWRFTYLNPQAEILLNRKKCDLLGKKLWDEFPGVAGSAFEPVYRKAAANEASTMTSFYPDHDRWYEVHGYPAPNGVTIYYKDVTENRRVEDALRKSEESLRWQALIFDITLSSIADFAYTFDREGKFIFANKPLLDLLEITLEDIVGKNFHDLNYPKALADRLQAQIQKVFDTKGVVRDETPFTNPSGRDGYYEYILSPVIAIDGTVEIVAGCTRDVTDRKAAEKAIRFQAHLLDTVEQAVIATDLGGTIIYWNRFAEDLYGWKSAEAVGRNVVDLITPEAMTGHADEILSRLRNRESWLGEFEVRRSNGTTFPAQVFNSPIIDDGDLIGIVGVSSDISTRKKREADLAFVADINEGLTAVDGIDEIMQTAGANIGAYLNLSVCAFIEIDEAADAAVVTHAWQLESSPDFRGSHRLSQYMTEEFQKAGRAGELFIVNDTQTDPRTDKAAFAAFDVRSFLSVPIVDNGQWCFEFIVYHTTAHEWSADEIELIPELTNSIWRRLQRAKTDESLRNSEERYRTLFESIDEGYCIIEVLFDDGGKAFDYRFIEVNPSFEKQSGIVAPIDKTILEIAPDIEPYWYESFGKIALTGDPARFEHRANALNRWFDVYACRFGKPENNQVAILFNDITDRKIAENELSEYRDGLETRVIERTVELAEANTSLKVENVERLRIEKERVRLLNQLVTTQEDERRRIARDLHDELGQQLTALRLKLKSAREMCDDAPVCKQIDETQQIAERLDADVSFLARELRPGSIDKQGLTGALAAFVKEWSKFSSVKAEFHVAGMQKIALTPEAETNLYRIAQEALNNTHKHSSAKNVSVLIEKRRTNIILIVEDDGIAFDPKAKLKRSKGLGLIGMHERAELLGGTLEIESSPGTGTTIFVRLPVTAVEVKKELNAK